MTRIAILDDYLKCALSSADWSVLPADAQINASSQHVKRPFGCIPFLKQLFAVDFMAVQRQAEHHDAHG